MIAVTTVTRGAEHLLRHTGEFDWSTVGIVLGPILGWV